MGLREVRPGGVRVGDELIILRNDANWAEVTVDETMLEMLPKWQKSVYKFILVRRPGAEA